MMYVKSVKGLVLRESYVVEHGFVKVISTVVCAFSDPIEPTIYMVKTPGSMLFMSIVLRVNVPVVASKLDYEFSSSI